LRRKLIGVLMTTLLCLAALPWMGRTSHAAAAGAPAPPTPTARPTATSRVSAPSTFAGLVNMVEAELDGVSVKALRLALGAVQCASASGDIAAPSTLTLIDYSRPSVEPRLWVFDLRSGRRLFKELVAHGRNTGENIATRFSDAVNSHQTSLGLFVARDTYVGANGYSLRLDGLEPGFNGRARERAIVMHGAPYVDPTLGATQGRIGRSWGCPALREGIARTVIDTIRGGGVIFSYYPDSNWLSGSRFLNGCGSTTT
jgi:L,D-transpeptidase catalytic domain